MKTYQVPTKAQVDEKSQAIFSQLTDKLGMVPNVYATMGYSSNGLESFLGLNQAQASGSFNAKEREAVALAVSQANECDYCLSAHTALAKMNGFTEEETLELRLRDFSDSRIQALVALAFEIVDTKGKPSEEAIEEFHKQGFDEKALIDLIILANQVSITNNIGTITKPKIDFPVAKSIEAVA